MPLPGLLEKLSIPSTADEQTKSGKTTKSRPDDNNGGNKRSVEKDVERASLDSTRSSSTVKPACSTDSSQTKRGSSHGKPDEVRKDTPNSGDESTASEQITAEPVSMDSSDEDRLRSGTANDESCEMAESPEALEGEEEPEIFKEPKRPQSSQPAPPKPGNPPRLSVDSQTRLHDNVKVNVTPATPVETVQSTTGVLARNRSKRHSAKSAQSSNAGANKEESSENTLKPHHNGEHRKITPTSSSEEVSTDHKEREREAERRKPVYPARALLQRLPSQAITDSPGSEAPPSPHSSTGHTTPHRFGVPHSPGGNEQSQRHSTDYRFPLTSHHSHEDDIAEETSAASSPSPSDIVSSPPQYASPPSSNTNLRPDTRHPSPRPRPQSRNNSTSSTGSVNDFSTPVGFLRHRRSSSQNAPKEVKETYGAGYKDLPDGKRKLNQYILTEDIGRGSFGVVTKARDENTGRDYAVKEFSKVRLRKRAQSEMMRRQGRGLRRGAVPMRQRGGMARDSSVGRHSADDARHEDDDLQPSPTQLRNDLDLIRSEVAVMKKVDHPNCVKLFEVLDVQEDDSLFMVVELCANGPIMQVNMNESAEPLPEETARNYFRQIVLAIEYLHHNGIIHRDIKPENILRMADPEEIKLVDFGVSEMFDKNLHEDNPTELKTAGSPAFMSPELCISHAGKVSGKATDIWALGVTLYCLAVGHLPFETTQMLDLYDKIKNDPVRIPKELSPSLKSLLAQLLEKDPEQRIKMDALREHPWLTLDGQDPLPSVEVNVTSLPAVTETDVDNAIAIPSVSYIVNAVRAASRWKRLTARRANSEGASDISFGSSNDNSRDMSRTGSHDPNFSSLSRSSTRNNDTLSPPTSNVPSKQNSLSSEHSLLDIASRISDPARLQPQANTSLSKAASYPLPETTSQTTAGTIVDFPDVTSRSSHLQHLQGGIDDCNLETLRYYEDQSGHVFPRQAVDAGVANRSPQVNTSPLPS